MCFFPSSSGLHHVVLLLPNFCGVGARAGGNKLRVTLAEPPPSEPENPPMVMCDVDQSKRSCAAH